MQLVLDGASLARFGDGELNICLGRGIKSQAYHEKLRRRLREILYDSGACLVGIPNVMANTKTFWDGFRTPRYAELFRPGRKYVSAFVTRPDSAPWINTPLYWRALEDLWRGEDVTLVRGSEKSLTRATLKSARSVREIFCAPQHAWASYSTLLTEVGTPRRALLCCGPTATVLAVDLCARGVHAVDLGHVGLWLKRLHLTPDEALQEVRRGL